MTVGTIHAVIEEGADGVGTSAYLQELVSRKNNRAPCFSTAKSRALRFSIVALMKKIGALAAPRIRLIACSSRRAPGRAAVLWRGPHGVCRSAG